MSEVKKCMYCGKLATIHLTQIVENKVHKVDICEACAHEKGISDPEGFNFDALLGGGGVNPQIDSFVEEENSVKCDISGASFADFKKTGRFGSSQCYDLFREELLPVLKNMHRKTRHNGKVPSSMQGYREAIQLEELQKNLQDAIDSERFEDAAKLRDEILLLDEKTG